MAPEISMKRHGNQLDSIRISLALEVDPHFENKFLGLSGVVIVQLKNL